MSTEAVIATLVAEFAADIRAGLSKDGQKELPSKYLYDAVGSALFEAITVLPEYGLTRADERLLTRHAPEIVARLPPPLCVAELGSGSAKKTRRLLETLVERQPTRYYPIDISAAALAQCRQELSGLDGLTLVGLEKPYLEGLHTVAGCRAAQEHLLLLFLGSTIGNFERPVAEKFLGEIRGILLPGDGLVLGTDLEKSIPQLLAAYDDPLGVTAAFNLNLLARINRELEGDFVLSQFEHVARYNDAERRIEMHLRSTVDQVVTIGKANCRVEFRKDETVWTESSHKYHREEVVELGRRNGFRCLAQWVDAEWPFAESLLRAD